MSTRQGSIILSIIVISFIIFSFSGCKGKKEPFEVTIIEYFKAMKEQDRKTMYSLTSEPVTIPYKSYKIVDMEKPVKEKYQLPILLEKIDKLKQRREKLAIKWHYIDDKLYDLEYELDETKIKEKKIELKKKIEEVEKILELKKSEYKNSNINKKIYELTKKIEAEKKFVKLSTGISESLQSFEGETHTVKVKLKTTLEDGEKKEFEILLKKYVLNQKVKPPAQSDQSNWIIVKIPDDKNFKNLANYDYVDYLFENLKKIYDPFDNIKKGDFSHYIFRSYICLTVEKDGKISINQEPVDLKNFENKLKEIYQNRENRTIYFRILKETNNYGEIVDLISTMRKCGIERILPFITDEIKPVILKRFNNQIDLELPEEYVGKCIPIEIPEGIEEEEIEDFGFDSDFFGVEGGVEGGVVGGVLGSDAPKETQALRIASIQKPRLIKSTKPEYPQIALRAKIQGNVIINATTDIYGRVIRAEVISGHPLLREAARAAVMKWVYEPYILKGFPRSVVFTVIVKFNLNNR
jgi:TonB family protein